MKGQTPYYHQKKGSRGAAYTLVGVDSDLEIDLRVGIGQPPTKLHLLFCNLPSLTSSEAGDENPIERLGSTRDQRTAHGTPVANAGSRGQRGVMWNRIEVLVGQTGGRNASSHRRAAALIADLLLRTGWTTFSPPGEQADER